MNKHPLLIELLKHRVKHTYEVLQTKKIKCSFDNSLEDDVPIIFFYKFEDLMTHLKK